MVSGNSSISVAGMPAMRLPPPNQIHRDDAAIGALDFYSVSFMMPSLQKTGHARCVFRFTVTPALPDK
jgi:hypothetical protein